MNRTAQQWVKRSIGVGVLTLVGLSSVAGPALAANAPAGSGTSAQIGGADRFETAALAAQQNWTSASTVIVANGDKGIDALSASYLAGVDDAPVLLTHANSVPSSTATVLANLNPTTVIVIGGLSAVDAATYDALTSGRTGQRITGADRYETSANILAASGQSPTSVFLAAGEGRDGGLPADALAAGAVAFRAHVPILLTQQGELSAAAAKVLGAGASGVATTQAVTTKIHKVIVVGGESVVSSDVLDAAGELTGSEPARAAGEDRSGTAAAIAGLAEAEGAGFSTSSLAIVNGSSADGLAAGTAAGKAGTPLLLTPNSSSIGAGTEKFLAEHADTLNSVTVYGGKSVVPTTLVDAVRQAGGGNIAPVTVVPTIPTKTPASPVVTPAPAALLSATASRSPWNSSLIDVRWNAAAGQNPQSVLVEAKIDGVWVEASRTNYLYDDRVTILSKSDDHVVGVTVRGPEVSGVYQYRVSVVSGTRKSSPVVVANPVAFVATPNVRAVTQEPGTIVVHVDPDVTGPTVHVNEVNGDLVTSTGQAEDAASGIRDGAESTLSSATTDLQVKEAALAEAEAAYADLPEEANPVDVESAEQDVVAAQGAVDAAQETYDAALGAQQEARSSYETALDAYQSALSGVDIHEGVRGLTYDAQDGTITFTAPSLSAPYWYRVQRSAYETASDWSSSTEFQVFGAPTVTSAPFVMSSAYTATGLATGATSVSVSVNGGPSQEATLVDGAWSASLVLAANTNTIAVTATNAAGLTTSTQVLVFSMTMPIILNPIQNLP